MRASTIIFNLAVSLERPGTMLIPANVCPIVAVTLMKAKRDIELVDIDPKTLCLDEEATMLKIANSPEKYSGIVFVHTYGTSYRSEKFFEELKKIAANLLIIDDYGSAVPLFEPPATAADVLIFSTGYAKYVDLGYGGYGFLQKSVRYRSERSSFNSADHDALVKEEKVALSANTKFQYRDSDWLDTRHPNTSFGRYRHSLMKNMALRAEHQNNLNRIYEEMIPRKYHLGKEFSNWRFNVLVPEKDKLLKRIFEYKASKLFASSHYQSLKDVFARGEDSVAAKLHQNIVNLFNNFQYTAEQARTTAWIVADYLDEAEANSRDGD